MQIIASGQSGHVASERPVYACIPYEVLRQPPIRHRHTEARKLYLSPFECALAVGLMITARAIWNEDKHQRALAAGHLAIEREGELANNFKQQWRETKQRRLNGAGYEQAPTPKRRHTFTDEYYKNEFVKFAGHSKYKPLERPRALKRAGREGYSKHRKKIRRERAPEIISVELSRRGLLIAAGLRSDGGNHYPIDQALDNLCEPIGSLPPILTNWQQLKNGHVRLEVRGLWLDLPFEKVPWPLPRSATALALYLFLQSIDTSYVNKTTIGFPSLCHKLGVTTDWGNRKSLRILENALDAVNVHLDTINRKALRKHNLTLPDRYEMITEADNRIRFEEMARQARDDIEDEIVDEEDIEDEIVDEEIDDFVPFVPSRHRQRPKIDPKPRPRIKKPRIDHEAMMQQAAKERELEFQEKAKLRHALLTEAELDRKYGRVGGK